MHPEVRADATHPLAEVFVRPWLAMISLGQREWIRFFRQRNRVVGALGQPILFWLLFGAGMQSVFRAEQQSFSEYYIPGTLMLILLFTAIFATISIIEDRREGFLQSVLVAPAPRWSMVLGKLLGGSLIAVVQGVLFLLLTLFLGIRFGFATAILLVAWLLVCAIGLTGLGFVIAWRMDSTQGFHAVMNLLLMPMWLLSGAFFPIPSLAADSGWVGLIMHWVMRLNPVTYAVAGLRRLLYRDMPGELAAVSGGSAIWVPGMDSCFLVVAAFTLLTLVLACRMARQPASGDLL